MRQRIKMSAAGLIPLAAVFMLVGALALQQPSAEAAGPNSTIFSSPLYSYVPAVNNTVEVSADGW